jgi:uncharacterized repeat protein (TIGR03803 family)
MKHAYGIDQISFGATTGDGSNQTIAIVVAYHNPSLRPSVDTFNNDNALTPFQNGTTVTTGPTLTVVDENSGINYPPENTGWDDEECLDVEWAHAIAPGANVVVVEAAKFDASTNFADMYTAEDTARNYSNVTVVSNSWDTSETSGESSHDGTFTTPLSKTGVAFVVASGDNGAIGEYPSMSPNVLSVGGTSLSVDGSGSYTSESVWNNSLGAGGGGDSQYEAEQSYQQNGADNGMGAISGTARRATPDVAMDADPFTGVYIIDQARHGDTPTQYGGTSLATPMWAALIAIADQGRADNTPSLGPLDMGTLHSDLYNAPPSYFHDVTTGNNGYAAVTGYDLASGRGSPMANLLVPYLAGYPVGTHLALANPPAITIAAGTSGLPTLTVNIEDANNSIIGTDNSVVTLSVYNSAATGVTLGSGTVTVNAVSGIATFSNLWITTPPNRAGTYQLVATDGSDVAATFSFTVVAAEASRAGAVSGSSLGTLTGASPSPSGGLTLAGGVLYGTTQQGGSAALGSVYEVNNGTLTPLYSFPSGGSDGSDPNGSVVVDSAGNIWGATYTGGDSNQDGTIFELSPGGTLIQSIAFSYSSTGSNPVGGLVADSAGDLFGVTQFGGSAGAGTVFEIDHGSSAISHVISLDGNGQTVQQRIQSGGEHERVVNRCADAVVSHQ